MVTSLSAELEEFVTALVASGNYKSRDEVFSEAVRLLREREEKRETLRGDIEAAIKQIENGEYFDYDDAALDEFFDELKAKAQGAHNAAHARSQ